MSHHDPFLDLPGEAPSYPDSAPLSDVGTENARSELHLRVVQGVHRGADAPLAPGDSCVVGSDPACTVVLCDAGVAPRHCLLTVDPLGVTCKALDAPVLVNGRELTAGQATVVSNFQSIQCGQAALSVGPGDIEWPTIDTAPRQRRRAGAVVSFACVLAAMLGLLGVSYNALSSRTADLGPNRLENARRWLKNIAPADSELKVRLESSNYLIVSGYVSTTYQRELLVAAANDSSLKPRVEVYATEEMLSSLLRLARLEQVTCVPKYKGGGEVACTNGVGVAAAAKLEAIAKQIPGVSALEVSASADPVAAFTSPSAPAAPAKISRRFSILMSKKGSYLVDERGVRYQEGDDYDGYTIAGIQLDQVIFMRDGREYAFHVASMGVM